MKCPGSQDFTKNVAGLGIRNIKKGGNGEIQTKGGTEEGEKNLGYRESAQLLGSLHWLRLGIPSGQRGGLGKYGGGKV